MGHQHVTNKRYRNRQQRPAVWLDGHGMDQIDSVSVSPTNKAGNSYDQIPEGQALGFDPVLNLSYPLAYSTLTEDVTSANVLPVSDIEQYTEGDLALIDGDFFRRITAVDDEAETITVDGAAITKSSGTTVEVDPTRAEAEVETTAAAPGTATTTIALLDGQAANFQVGDLAQIGAVGTKAYVFTPTPADDAQFEIHGILSLNGVETPIDLAINSGTGATAQSIVEALDASADSELPAAIAVGSEDDTAFTLTITDPGAEFTYTHSDNLALSVKDKTTARVSAVDTGADTITVEADIAVQDGDLVVSSRRGGYEISTETVDIYGYHYIPDNVLVPTRSHGRVAEAFVLGLTPSVKAALQGLIKFV